MISIDQIYAAGTLNKSQDARVLLLKDKQRDVSPSCSVNNLWNQRLEFFKVWKDVGRHIFFCEQLLSEFRQLKIQKQKGKHGGVPLVKVHRTGLTALVGIRRVDDPRNLIFRHHRAKDVKELQTYCIWLMNCAPEQTRQHTVYTR